MTEQGSSDLLLLKSAEAHKVGQRSTGSIDYEVLTDMNRQVVWLRIVGNTSRGYFSSEKIDFEKAVACVKNIQADQPFPSKLLGGAFVGRSANNAGFLVAVLRAEKLLIAATNSIHQHLVAGDWRAWKQEMLALTGIPLAAEVEAKSEAQPPIVENNSVAFPEHKEHTKRQKSGRSNGADRSR